jgi:DNA-binding response OmpR family regulator
MKKILLVEDDVDLNRAYSLILKQDKYDVESAFNGEEALEILERFEPDLILLDLLMPIKSGIDFLEEYSASKLTRPRILVITNLENTGEISKALELGGYKCIVKSHTTPQGLKKIVKTTLKNQG